MKEPEYVLTSDKKNWMDTGVISTIPYKVTIFEMRTFIARCEDLLSMTATIRELKLPPLELRTMATQLTMNIFEALVNHRCAWKNSYNGDLETGELYVVENFANCFTAEVRDSLRYELGIEQDEITVGVVEKYSKIPIMKWMLVAFKGFTTTVSSILRENMNPNPYVIHEMRLGKDGRTIRLEEFSDWRVLQWTLQQQAEIDAKREQS